MPCYHPLEGYYAKTLNRSGKRSIVFNSHLALTPDVSIKLPCGKCLGCRLDRSKEWAIRCMHESRMHDENCFITLTYNDESLPDDQSLHKKDFQDFIKRLRKQTFPASPRYYMCGEYGDQNRRPHFHACIFGYRPTDLKFHSKNVQGHPLYTSQKLSKIWNLGHAIIGEFSFETAAYVSRYIMKKVVGKDAHEHYDSVNIYTGEVTTRLPEYNQASLKPAIGLTWFEKNQQYIKDHDFVVMNGKKLKPPKYYDKKLEISDPANSENRKEQRVEKARPQLHDNTPDRLAVKEAVHRAQASTLKRKTE